jgi:hypothetical protein
MSFNNGPRTVVTGLSLLVDAADPLSYPGSGTSWTDIVTGITGSLSGSITYASDFKGTLVVNNSSSVIIFPTSSGNFGSNSFTVELAFQPNQINGQHWLVAKNSGSFPSWGAFITGSSGSGRITAFFNVSSTISCSMSTPTDSIVTGSNYLIDINFLPNNSLNTIYLNSELSGSVIPNGGGSLTATSSLFISNRNSGSSVGAPLEIFNTKLYTPKLVAGSIRQNYNSLSTRLGLPQKTFLIINDDPLLDLYPNAAAAYSLRLLNSNHGGAAIQVRRSSDNVVANIGFTSNGGLDTSALLAHCGSGDGFVTTWYDQSGNGRNATQATAANQPQIVSSGSVLTLNSKPSLQFDGTNDGLFTANKVYTTNNILGVAVAKTNNNLVSQAIVSQNDFFVTPTGRSTLMGIDGATSKGQFFFNNGTSYSTLSANTIANNTQFLMLNYSSANNYFASLNGSAGNLGTTGQTFTPESTNMGIGINPSITGFLNGNIQEVVIYNSDQISNKTGIETNINSFYSIY